MKHIIKLILILTLPWLIFSCKKNNLPEDVVVPPPSQLTVEVLQRNASSASINWAHTGYVNESTTRYRVVLDGVLFKDNLTGSSTEITGLKGSVEYKGKLIAYNSMGNLATAEFILEAVNGYIISVGSTMLSCNLISGGTAWSYYSGTYAASPAVAGDTVFIYTNVASIVALNLHTGKLIWELESLPFIQKNISLLHHKNTIYATVSGGVEAYNSSSGAFKWKYSNNLLWSDMNEPIIAGNLLIIGSQMNLIAIDLDSHQMAWIYNVKTFMNKSPVVYKDKVIFSDRAGYAYALNAKTGKEVWSKELKRQDPVATGGLMTTPVISGEVLIVNASGSGHYALNANTGDILWKTSHINGSDVAAGDGMVFYVYDKDPYALICVNALNGKLLWEKRLVYSYATSTLPIYANGKLYSNGRIYSALNGTDIGSMGADSYSSVVIVDKGIAYYQPVSGMAN